MEKEMKIDQVLEMYIAIIETGCKTFQYLVRNT